MRWAVCAIAVPAALLAAQSALRAQDEDDPFADLPVEAADAPPPERADAGVEGEGEAPASPWHQGEAFGDFELELRAFPRAPLSEAQPRYTSTAFAFRPGYSKALGDAAAIRFVGLVRLDEHDAERSHVDAREGLLEVRGGAFTARAGMNTVFWGVTESRHLVNIVNQVDYLEDFDGEARFGQLMAMLSYEHERWGLLDVFAMSWFRPQRYPSTAGRPGTPLRVLDDAIYEAELERWNVDAAARWSNGAGALDWAVSYFYGTSREPQLRVVPFDGGFALQPAYELIHQGGVELQYTAGTWLWKLEGIAREGQGPRFAAATGGVEKTLPAFVGKRDVTLFLEYSYDGRDDDTLTFYDRELFAAARLSLNDAASTEATLAATVDVVSGDAVAAMELSRRFGAQWKATVEARVFRATDERDPLYWFRRDHYVEAAVRYYY